MIARIILLLCLCLSAGTLRAATYTVVADRDSHLREDNPNTNYGNLTTFNVRNPATNDRRPVIGFTLPAIASGEIITSATIRLWVTAENNDVVSLHRVTDTWAEGSVTWNNTAADFNAAAETSQAVNSSSAYVTFTVTALVSNWVSGAAANNGVMLIGDAGADTTFASSENGTVNRRPELTITTAAIPPLTTVKSSQPYFDPYNGTTNPKLIPEAFVAYTVTVANSGTYTVTSNSVVITDPTPAGLHLYVGNVPGGTGPVLFAASGSGLTYTYTSLASTTDDVDFSNNGGATWTYVPVPNASQADPAVTHIRIRPQGSMAAASSFSLQWGYQVQ